MRSKKYTSQLESLRKTVFYISCTGIMLYVAAGLAGLSETPRRLLLTSEIVQILTLSITLGLVYWKKIRIIHALVILLTFSQIKICAEMLYYAYSPDIERSALILRDMTRLGFTLMFAVLAYVPVLPFILGGLSLGTYTACVVINDSLFLHNSYITFFVLFATSALLGNYMARKVIILQHDNQAYKSERRSILNLLNLDDRQLDQLTRLLKKRKLAPRQTETLLKLLGPDTETRIRRSVLSMMQQQEVDNRLFDERMPGLTPTERRVAHLILQGKTHSDISRELLKSQSNISVIRSNIRKKLGLAQHDNLHERLLALARQQPAAPEPDPDTTT
ncbi:MAG: helix-turn-helix transcriptional regulator [Rikenellaceae bacterium]|nr:helix-turn-helix transcriptional regulator [Rikenellaceae bacterium]